MSEGFPRMTTTNPDFATSARALSTTAKFSVSETNASLSAAVKSPNGRKICASRFQCARAAGDRLRGIRSRQSGLGSSWLSRRWCDPVSSLSGLGFGGLPVFIGEPFQGPAGQCREFFQGQLAATHQYRFFHIGRKLRIDGASRQL